MGIAASLNGNRVTDVRSTIPGWGVSYHDVTVDGNVTLSGAVTLVVADLTIAGTILTGGSSGAGRSFFRLVAGAGGWGKQLPAKSYSNDFGVKLLTVLQDAATAVGETLDTTTIDPKATLGPFFVRPAGPACRLLEQLSSSSWYIGEDGKTRLGARPATTLSTKVTYVVPLDLARGTVTIASETIANILPGLAVDGLTAVDVEHEYSAANGLRSKIWGRQGGAASRRISALRALVDQLDPDRAFRGTWEYRIVTQDGVRLNLQPVRASSGMPDLARVMVRPGVPGFSAQHMLGARVLVTFVDGDPSRPVVVSFEDAEGSGFSPSSVSISAGGMAATEHVTTIEAVVNLLMALMPAVITGGSPAPLTDPQLAAAVAAAASADLTTSAPLSMAAILTALSAKSSDQTGTKPGVGCPNLKVG